jgi:hypothetical protein
MACSITIDIGTAVALQNAIGQPPTTIHVQGTATDCKNVVVLLGAGASPAQVVAPVGEDGTWLAVFNAPADFDPADFPCGAQDIKILARCQEDPSCGAEGVIPVLNCLPRDCPEQVVLMVFGDAGPDHPFDPSHCLPPGPYTIRVVDPYSPTALYHWGVNGASQGALSGAGQHEFPYTVAAGGAPQYVSVAVQWTPTCPLLSGGMMLSSCDAPPPPPPPPPDCPTSVALQVSSGGQAVDPAECVPPGTYAVVVTTPVGPDVQYTWSVDNVLQAGASSAVFTVNVGINATRAVQVSAVRAGCPPVPGSVTLTACPAGRECADAIVFRVLDDQGRPVFTDDCLPAGTYTVEVLQPGGGGTTYGWLVDGQSQPGATGSRFEVVVEAGVTVEVSVRARVPGCPDVRDSVTLRGCGSTRDCPQNISLSVFGEPGGAPVNAGRCLPAGNYRVRVDTPAGAGYVWSVGGNVQQGATGQDLLVSLPAGQSVQVAVTATVPRCPPLPGGITLRTCNDPGPEPPVWCPWLYMGGLILLIIGLVLTFAGFCSGNVPLAIAGIVMAMVGFGLLLAWAFLCASARGGCDLFRRLLGLLSIIAILLGVVGAIFAVIALICAAITSPTGWLLILCGLPSACGIGVLIDLAIVGALLGILTLIYLATCDGR